MLVAPAPWAYAPIVHAAPARATCSASSSVRRPPAGGPSGCRSGAAKPLAVRSATYPSYLAPISANDAWGSIRIWWPIDAAQPRASGDVAATHVGGCGSLHRLREDLDVVEVPELAVERQPLVRPRRQHDLHGLAEPGRGLVAGDAERGELGRLEAAPGTPVDAAAGEHVDAARPPRRGAAGGTARRATPRCRSAGSIVRCAASSAIRWTDGHTLYVVKWCSASHTAS